MEATSQELLGLSVHLDKLLHHRDANFPAETPHAFVYFLTIKNLSPETVELTGRKWILKHASGETEIFEGDGIVGQNPRIPPGEAFSYNSFHLTGDTVVASGAFHGTTDQGRRIFVRIPSFTMTPPETF